MKRLAKHFLLSTLLAISLLTFSSCETDDSEIFENVDLEIETETNQGKDKKQGVG